MLVSVGLDNFALNSLSFFSEEVRRPLVNQGSLLINFLFLFKVFRGNAFSNSLWYLLITHYMQIWHIV